MYTQITYFISRAILIFIIVPSSIVGTILFIYLAQPQYSLDKALNEAFEYTESVIKPTSPGMILTWDCPNNSADSEAFTKPLVICGKDSKQIEIPAATLIDSLIRFLQGAYLVIVLSALLIAFAFKLNGINIRFKLAKIFASDNEININPKNESGN